ncbi:CAP domain-containing protein [Patescibacteria group bacterium]|nr:CAP domain-containing protein [Patescibacteria group bacterium]
MRKFLRHLFLPHESNNHRAKILHIDSILIVITLLVFSSFLLSSLQSRFPAVLGISYNITPNDLLNQTNQVRLERGLSTLTLNSELSQAASNKAADMFAKDYWAHVAPDGATPWGFIKNSGYEYLYAGENLARGFSNTSDVISAWMASPSHRDNVLSSNYSDVGFAITTGNLTGSDTVLVVEMFGTKYAGAAAAPLIAVSPIPTPTRPDLNLSEPSPTIIFVTENITLVPSQPEEPQSKVASIQQQPLIDKNDLTKNILVIVLIVLITILTVDAIIIEKKKIIRVVSHNLDHIIYLIIILLTIIIIGRGVVL